MASTERHTLPGGRAWLAPIAAAVVVIGGAVALGGVHPGSALAAAHPSLPTQTPEQLLTAVENSSTRAASGTVTESAHWGLPSLPGSADSASLNWQGLLTGNHTMRVAFDGADKQRIAVLGSLSESDLVHDGKDLWTYTSATNAVTHSVLTSDTEAHSGSDANPAESLTPDGAARRLLAAISPTTDVSVDATQRVAGRSAYTLVLSPKDRRSTVRKVAIAVDGRSFVPLSVKVYGSSNTAAFQTTFTSISFKTPSASTFAFHPPTGSTVAADPFGLAGQRVGASAAGGPPPPRLTTLGSGWATVVEIPAGIAAGGSDAVDRHRAASPTALLNSLTSPLGDTGNRVLRTSIINALITADGRIYAGAVPTDLLQAAAAGTYK